VSDGERTAGACGDLEVCCDIAGLAHGPPKQASNQMKATVWKNRDGEIETRIKIYPLYS